MKVALVCIAKDEENYIQEWIDYNLKLGFDRIFLYQNDWTWEGENENVEKIQYNGLFVQERAYNNFIRNNRGKYDWAAFFDVDEFLVLKKHDNIKSFLKDYSDYNCVGINWVFFGDNGKVDVENNEYSVLKRFTKSQPFPDRHIKSIVRVNKVNNMSIHASDLNWVDTDKIVNRGPFNPNPKNNIAQINHYYTKSFEEFKKKCKRGRADKSEKRDISEFNHHTTTDNQIEDLTAYNFMYK